MKARKFLSIMECFTLIVVTCVCMLFSVGCSKNKPKKEADGSLVVTPGEVQGDMISLLTQGPSASTSEYTLTVVLNEDCPDEFKRISWTIAWKNASSTWASGKTVTDYVTLTTTQNSPLTAKVTKVEAFGEQICVTATAVYDNKLSAVATLDCVKKITNATVKESSHVLTYGQAPHFTLNYEYSIGTLTPEVKTSDLSYYMDFPYEYEESLQDDIYMFDGEEDTSFSDNVVLVKRKNYAWNTPITVASFLEYKDSSYFETPGYKYMFNTILNSMGWGADNTIKSYEFYVSGSYRYNNVVLGSFNTGRLYVGFDISSATPYKFVTSVSLADSSIIFA